MPSATNLAWAESDYQFACQLAKTMPHRSVAERYGISPKALGHRLRRYRQRYGGTRPYDTRLLTPSDVAAVLGCQRSTLRRWREKGLLCFSQCGVSGWPACTVRDLLAFLELGYALCPAIQPPATELFWAQQVTRIRRDLHQRWVLQREVIRALCISFDCVNHWRRRHGFPHPIFDLGMYGCWLEREAVIAWLNQWPRRYTKAAKRLLEGTQ